MSSLPLAEVRRRFFDGDELPENSVPSPILHSWRRCLGLGLPAGRLRLPERLDTHTLQQRQQASADWLQLAKPAIDALFDSVVDDGHVVIVADADGVILNQMGHPAFLDRAERVALLPGMDWRPMPSAPHWSPATAYGCAAANTIWNATASCRAPPVPFSIRKAACSVYWMFPACHASWARRNNYRS